MAASALELRPRGPVALLDAAIRLCGSNSGLWSLALPGGALVTGALVAWSDAIHERRPLFFPSLLLTLAWFARGIFQGAACHYVERHVLGPEEPSTWGSLWAALRRAPSLIIAVAMVLGINLVTLPLTLGLAFFFISAHLVAYAAAMQGRGSPLALYRTCGQLLGPARGSTAWVRLCLWVQVLVILNLHIAANALIFVCQKLLALDLSYASRYASLDNTTWVLAICALGFTLMEPLRAAAAALLLVDGRVRQEGLDLTAALEQLPRRRPNRLTSAQAPGKVAAAVLALGALLTPADTLAQARKRPPTSPEISQRLGKVLDHCELDRGEYAQELQAVAALGEGERSSLTRFLAQVEAQAYDDEDCEGVELRLSRGLPLIADAKTALDDRAEQARAAQQRAEDILSRPEFARRPAIAKDEPAPKPDEEVPDPNSWWNRFKRWLGRLFERLFEQEPRRPISVAPASASGMAVANVLVIVLVAAVVIVLGGILWRAWAQRKPSAGGELQLTTAPGEVVHDSESALSRPPEGWASLADELAAKGQFREAVRSLYLALLSRLHRDGAIDYHPAHSNWDYFRRFKGPRDWLPPFRELTARFDIAYYSTEVIGADGYQSFRALSAPLLAPAPEAPGA